MLRQQGLVSLFFAVSRLCFPVALFTVLYDTGRCTRTGGVMTDFTVRLFVEVHTPGCTSASFCAFNFFISIGKLVLELQKNY